MRKDGETNREWIERATKEQQVVPDLYRLAYVPGSFRCPKCGFVLSKQTMFVASGTIGISESDLNGEPCPNDGTDMVHVTWQERAIELSDRLSEVVKWEKKHPLNWKQDRGKLADALGLNVEECRKIEQIVEQHIRDNKTLKQLLETVGEMEISDALWANFLYTYGYFDGRRS